MTTQEEFYQHANNFDYIDSLLCNCLFDVCNDRMIESTTRVNFINWLNFKPSRPTISLLPGEKRRFFHFVKEIAEYVSDKRYRKEWINAMLESCNINYENYDKHASDVSGCNSSTTKNEAFNKALKDAISRYNIFVNPYLNEQLMDFFDDLRKNMKKK
jgi:hypothetical protein